MLRRNASRPVAARPLAASRSGPLMRLPSSRAFPKTFMTAAYPLAGRRALVGYNGNAAFESPAQRPYQQAGKPRSSATVSKKAIELELPWVQDRVMLSDRIWTLLKKDDFDKARELVRAAHKNGVDTIASWNLLLQYEMDRSKPLAAFSLYNDMKKRGQKPNSRTYTIMFRGLAQRPLPDSVRIALSIHKSLCSPNSEVTPSVIHNNALLTVCARSGDMDTLWEIAGQLPERGYGAPDGRTLTIILNALKVTTEREVRRLNPWSQRREIATKKASVAREGKRIWADIVEQYKRAELVLDQSLVSAMARLLVFGGRERDCLDVLYLYRQTMGFAIPDEKGHPIKTDQSSDAAVQNKTPPRVYIPEASRSLGSQIKQRPEQPTEDEEFKHLFDVIPTAVVCKNIELRTDEKVPDIALPAPANEDLTTILEACRIMNRRVGLPMGRYYWSFLTSPTGPYNLQPDILSFHEYLRLLRVARASRETLRVIREMAVIQGVPPEPNATSNPNNGQEPLLLLGKTFIIALSTCLRDRKNPHVFDTAGQLLELMGQALPVPEPRVLLRFHSLVLYLTAPEQLQQRAAAEGPVTIATKSGKEDVPDATAAAESGSPGQQQQPQQPTASPSSPETEADKSKTDKEEQEQQPEQPQQRQKGQQQKEQHPQTKLRSSQHAFKFLHTEALRLLRPHVIRIKQVLAYGRPGPAPDAHRFISHADEDTSLDKTALANLAAGSFPLSPSPSPASASASSLAGAAGAADAAADGRRRRSHAQQQNRRTTNLLPTLDVDHALTALLRVAEMHNQLLYLPPIASPPAPGSLLTPSAREWYTKEAKRLRKFVRPRLKGNQRWNTNVILDDEEEGQKGKR